MRVQFLHPPTFVAPGNLQNNRPSQPLGLAYVVAAVRQAGHECTILDAIAEAPEQRIAAGRLMRLGLTDEQILDRIDPQAPVLALTNMFSFNWPTLRELIRKIRARFPEKIIVAGGEHFTGLPELSMREAPIDYIVLGEGEEVATELLARIEGGAFDPSEVRGICWRRGEEIVLNPRASRVRDVDELPWPAWDLFDVAGYNRHNLVFGLCWGTTIPILATRGCPYQCTYCSSPRMWTTRWWSRDPIRVVDEIEHLHQRYGATNFPMQDLTMIIKKDWVVTFCQEIIRRGLQISWQLPAGTRCEVIDDEVAGLLRESGCRFLCYAPESGSERTRELIKKKMKRESFLSAVDAALGAGLSLETFFVIGFPHDTADDLRQTARLAREIARRGVEDIAVNVYFPIPATELFGYLEKTGRVTLNDDQLMDPVFVHQLRLSEERNYCEHLSAEELSRWKLRILANFYLTSFLTHPTRVVRVLYHALRGRQTSPLEKFLGERLGRGAPRNPNTLAPSAVAERPAA
jgi:radical SAM superfamily enzyme YgiQ (UPF0313 family)